MRNLLFTVLTITLMVSLGSCRKDFNTQASTGNLRFSTQTVLLDTVFTTIGSSTYNLKVYNDSDTDMHIPTINLNSGAASHYRLMVDGIAGQQFENIEIKAKDSLFVFIETTVDILDYTTTATEFLYEDEIVFDTNAFEQKVNLVTLVKDAEFIYPTTLVTGELNDFDLTTAQLNFTNTKPYVIYGFPKVPTGETLTIDAGSRIHFHRDSGLIVADGATINANGALSTDPLLLENEIIFQGDRLEHLYENIPGQWGTIWLQEGSTNNIFNHVTIKNGTIGLRSDGNDGDLTTTITNTQLYNHSVNGIFAFNGNIEGKNVVVSNCGQASVSLLLGGAYDFTHCTFTNYWNSSNRSHPTLLVSNQLENDGTLFLADLTQANFTNCIVYGNENIELELLKDNTVAFNYNFSNCLLRFNDTNNQFSSNALYDFNDTNIFDTIIRNQNPQFKNITLNDFNIEEGNSAAENSALDLSPTFNDLLGTPRPINNSDIGAYQATIFN